jgi:predicted lysophospholipase L1 biosynthesis ABC-type transport system permease subunit
MIMLKEQAPPDQGPQLKPMQIAGVAGNVIAGSLRKRDVAIIYRPLTQFQEDLFGFPGTLAGASCVLIAVGAFAWLPARRAIRVDPTVVLKAK